MTTITIASIELKEKRSIVITTQGRRLGCWTTNLGKFGLETGGTFEVETEDSDFNGRTLTNIIQAKKVGSMPPPAAAPAAPQAAPFRTPEQMFVSEVLTSYIANGRCAPEKLTETIRFIRAAWQNTFGTDDRIYPASEAGRHAA
jgi:hypothetical protein